MTMGQRGQTLMQQRCDHVIRALNIPRPMTIKGLVNAASELHHRPIRLLSATEVPSTIGCLLTRKPDADYLLYNADASTLHTLHSVAHEIGHLLLNHPFEIVHDIERLQRDVAPDLSLTLIRKLMGQSGPSTQDETRAEAETEAELFAFRVIAHAIRPLESASSPAANRHGLAEAFDLSAMPP